MPAKIIEGLAIRVENILDNQFSDRIYSVEDGVVWVSGMNQHCGSVARQMADTLVRVDIPCSLDTKVIGVKSGGGYTKIERELKETPRPIYSIECKDIPHKK